MIVRANKGTGVSGAVRYVLGEGKRDPVTGKVPELAPGEQSRVAWYGGTGFGFAIDSDERLEIGRRVMEWSAANQSSRTKKCQTDCLHLMLAWDRDQRPDRAQMEAAAHSVLERLGMGHARAIWACHDDTDHHHLHIVASRIDPESGRAFSDSYDQTVLSAWALAYEREHGGIRCEARLEREQAKAARDPERAINALASSRETFTERDLQRALTEAIPSRDTRRAYIEGVLARHDIVRLADGETGKVTRYTTRQTLAAEHLAERLGDRRDADRSHQVSGRALNGVLDGLNADGRALRDDQARALLHATRAPGLAVITGKAGTGKSFTMKAIQDAYAADGYEVKTLAPTNKVASALKRDGLDAGTVHSMLGSLDRGREEWTRDTVLMVDEAGMVSTRLMARLLSHADHVGAKVILVGDEKQLASMDRGGMFGFFAARHGAAELSQITRQNSAEQRELAVRASHYDFAGTLESLRKAGGLAVVEEGQRIAKAAAIWRERTGAAPERSLFVVAVSNADAEAANQAIRQVRRDRGELGTDEVLATRDGPKRFAVGDRVLFSGSAQKRKEREAGLANGNAGRVTAIAGDQLTVVIDGARKGDTVTFTVGKNAEAGEFDAIRHGYAGTIYKAQGATYDEAIVLDSATLKASAAYVALTRHRNHVTVVTSTDLAHAHAEPWMAGTQGYDALSPALQESAAKSYETWRTANPEAGKAHGVVEYVAYVQSKEAERRAENDGADTAEIARRWQRADDRRAASRFEPLNYCPADLTSMTPAAVRAAVGIEAFETGESLPDPIAQARVAGLADLERGVTARKERRLDALYGAAEPEPPRTPASPEPAADADRDRPEWWGERRPPGEPLSPEQAQAVMQQEAGPYLDQLQEHGVLQDGEPEGLRMHERVARRTAELLRSAVSWAQNKWQSYVANRRHRAEHRGRGPDLER